MDDELRREERRAEERRAEAKRVADRDHENFLLDSAYAREQCEKSLEKAKQAIRDGNTKAAANYLDIDLPSTGAAGVSAGAASRPSVESPKLSFDEAYDRAAEAQRALYDRIGWRIKTTFIPDQIKYLEQFQDWLMDLNLPDARTPELLDRVFVRDAWGKADYSFADAIKRLRQACIEVQEARNDSR